MNDQDTLQRFVFDNAAVRGELVHLNASFQTIMDQHDYPPIIRQLLGEVLVAATLLSSIIKFKGRLTVQFQGKGDLKLLLAQCDDQFHLRGLAQWQGELDQTSLTTSAEQGVLVITIDNQGSVKPYQGIVAWQGGSLAQSIEGYFRDSAQLPTRLWLAVNENSAAGLLLQTMPVQSTESTDDQEWEHLVHLTQTITFSELLNLNNETILRRLYSQEAVRVFDPLPVMFSCTCSAERSQKALLLLERDEIEAELKDKQCIVIACDFCNKQFIFDRVDVANIFKGGDPQPTSTQIH